MTAMTKKRIYMAGCGDMLGISYKMNALPSFISDKYVVSETGYDVYH